MPISKLPPGVFTLVDFHRPTNGLLLPGLAVFLWLFETQTSWHLLDIDLAVDLLAKVGFLEVKKRLFAGGSLQVIQAQKLRPVFLIGGA